MGGWPGFYLQVLRGDHDRHSPRRHHPRPQDQLDVRRRPETQGAPWSYCCRQELSRPWQGTQVQPDQGRQQARQLAEEEQSEAEEEAIDCDLSCPCIPLWAEIYFQIRKK